MKYTAPEMEIKALEVEDIIMASTGKPVLPDDEF